MAVKATESNKLIVYGMSFDLSSNTSLEITITDPDGTVVSVDGSRITAPSSPITVDGVIFASDSYMQFYTLATDFLVAGDYVLCGTYLNTGASPNTAEFYADPLTIPVAEPC